MEKSLEEKLKELNEEEKELTSKLRKISDSKKELEDEIEWNESGDILEDRWFYCDKILSNTLVPILFHSYKSVNKAHAIDTRKYLVDKCSIWQEVRFYGDAFYFSVDYNDYYKVGEVHIKFNNDGGDYREKKPYIFLSNDVPSNWAKCSKELEEGVISIIPNSMNVHFLNTKEEEVEEFIQKNIEKFFNSHNVEGLNYNGADGTNINIKFKVSVESPN